MPPKHTELTEQRTQKDSLANTVDDRLKMKYQLYDLVYGVKI